MRIRVYLLLLGLLLFSLWSVHAVHAASSVGQANSVKTQSTGPFITVKILSAYYTDLDGDGNEDDVYALTHIELGGFATYNVDYYVNLTLPSGTTYLYRILITSQVTSFDLNNLFYNHATEQGNYSLTVTAFLLNGASSYDQHAYVFDPPGGSDGGDPTFDVE